MKIRFLQTWMGTILLIACLPLRAPAEDGWRVWTDVYGNQIEAILLEQGSDTVILQDKDNQQYSIPVSQLAPADRMFLLQSARDPQQGGQATNQGVLLIKENFERGGRGSDFMNDLVRNPFLEIARGEGVNGGDALLARYEGFDRGSQRIGARYPLKNAADEVTLCFDVHFKDDFDFVRGGKLHGLAPARAITGGNPTTPEGYSARLMFGREGSLRTYIYHQDQTGRFGEGVTAADFRFERGKYYAISMHVKLNDPPAEANGWVHVYVNGEHLIEHRDLRFRDRDGRNTLISQFYFSTFHGGSNPDWAPRNPDGSYATVHALFDNFAAYQGKSVRLTPGICWE